MKVKLDRPTDRLNGNHCFVCGPDNPKGLHLEFYRLDDETVTAELEPPPEWTGWDQLMHGGLQCVLLDEITAWALTGLRNRQYFLTTGLEVRYRRPVRVKQKLTLVGRILEETSRGSRIQGQILNAAGDVLSEAVARVVHLDEGRFLDVVRSAP